jgi:hypothetical protein
MDIRSFTKEKLEKLKNMLDIKTHELNKIIKISINKMWINDLTELYNILDKDFCP